MKAIVIISNSMWSIHNFRRNLASTLAHTCSTIHLIAPFDGYERGFSGFPYVLHDIRLDRKGSNPLVELPLVYHIWRLFRKIRPASVLSFTIKPNIYSSFIGLISRIPIIPNVTGRGTIFSQTPMVKGVIMLLYRLAFSRHKTVFFQNNEDLDFFIRNHIIRPSQARKLPGSGVDLTAYAGTSMARPLHRFLFMGRMLIEKGVWEFIHAAACIRQHHPDVVFQLLGPCDEGNPGGIREETLRTLSSSAGVEYAGAADAVHEYIEKADCIVLPSYYNEGVPRSLLEAAAMAKPVITTDWPGCRDAVDDGITGFLCRPRDADDLALKMEKMLQLTMEERMHMGKKGREKVKREFDERIVIKAYLDVINSLP